MAPKRKAKMTWEKLANDPSISKSELPRIARAFGLKKPEDVPDVAKRSRTEGSKPATVQKRSRTEGVTKKVAAPKKAAPKATAKSRMKAAFSKPRTKLSAEKPKAKPKAKAKSTRTPTRMATGTEGGFEEGTYRQRVKRVQAPGGKAGKRVTFKKVKQPGASPLRTQSRGKGGRGQLTEAGKMVERLRKSRTSRR